MMKYLQFQMNMVYPRQGHTSSKSSIDNDAFNSGKKAGLGLTINQALKNKSGKIKQLIGM